jgi:type I restriction enzyme S subunit
VESNQLGEAPFGSVHFDGSITLRPPAVTIRGATYLAHPEDLVFSRIDLRNGAIGVVSREQGELAFTNEYPIYDIVSSGRVLPGYASLVCRTELFRSQVQALSVGHSGRKRVSWKQFEELRIPTPPVAEQQQLITAHQQQLTDIAQLRSTARQLPLEAVTTITKMLGLRSPDLTPIKFPFVIASHLSDRWSVFSAIAAVGGTTGEVESAYPVRLLGSGGLADVSYGISKSPKNRPGRNSRPYLRVANVQDGYLDLSAIKYIDVMPDQFARFRLLRDDVLVCEANGTLANVARPAIWNDQIPDCVHQNHVLRVRASAAVFLPDYLVAYMQTAPARGYFQRRAKTTTGLFTINSTDVDELPVPIPPLAVQQDVARIWKTAREEADRLVVAAEAAELRVVADTERRITGG